MTEDRSKRRLGRGLAALLGDAETAEADLAARARSQRRVPIEFLERNPRNPRTTFGDADLAELTASVKEKGIVQPILVRPKDGRADAFEIIAGERRWRAAQRAGLHEVPVIVQDVSDREALELAIIENVQRADLNPVEEARGYSRLMEEFSYRQADLAGVIGKSRSHVANTLRLLKLPQSIQDSLGSGALSAGHARALITADDAESLARRIVDEGLSVRDAEALAHAPAPARGAAGKAPAAKPEKDADTRALERRLADALGLKVAISHKANGAGELRVKYRDVDQLEGLCRRLGVE